ncbi:LPXTG cell wall anchor domain-containing protein, partial [Limosilactobacillus secaliphilus]
NAAKKSTVKAAAKNTKKSALPQTGNNSAAVVALGALSGMLGLGLAAKKREF